MHYETQATLLVDEGAALSRARGPGAAVERAALDVIVIGGGQAGLSVGYHLRKRGLRFLIVDASERVGDSWRKRWDSLRLFTPAWLDSLDGLPFPGPAGHFPTKDEMADYLETYARHFELPVLSGARVSSLEARDGGYVVRTSQGALRAPQVIVAMSNYQRRRLPPFARDLAPGIVQIHSLEYQRPSELAPGPVLVAGAGNSGAEIGMDLAKNGRSVVLAGRDVGFVPFRIASFWGKWVAIRILMRVVFHRIFTIRTPIGRKVRPKMLGKATPLIRQREEDLRGAGIERAARVVGVENGKPILEDGRVLDVANVVWATGFDSALDFIQLPIFDDRGEPRHEAGVVHDAPGLYFLGQHFLYAFSSSMIHGVGRDAARIAGVVAARASARARAELGLPKK